MAMKPSTTHLFIPDVQIRPDSNTRNITWFGRYAYEVATKRPGPFKVIVIGDWHDFPSLSSYDKPGSKNAENQRIVLDLAAGNREIDRFSDYLDRADTIREKRGFPKIERHFFEGNHEYRLWRMMENEAKHDGTYGRESFRWLARGWKHYPFLKVVKIDGIAYSHYFYNPLTSRPYAGNSIDTRLKTIGCSFSMGHQQVHLTGMRQTISGPHRGLVSGVAYIDDAEYIGPQGNAEKRLIVVKNEVKSGDYDICEVSLDFLCRKYEGKTLAEFKRGKS